MSRAWLGLGANINDPDARLNEALDRLDDHPDISIVHRSTIIRTEPWGVTDQPEFLNMAVEIDTGLSPRTLMTACLEIEQAMGRHRTQKWGPRRIDIDIIAFGRETIDEPGLTLPHPLAHERDFVMDPLREIAPQTADWIEERAAARATG